MSKKHIPYRTCAVTKEKLPKTELIKITRVNRSPVGAISSSAGEVGNHPYKKERTGFDIVIDQDQSQFGRSFYLKPENGLMEQALKRNAIKHHFGVSLDEKEKLDLIEEFEKVIKN